MACLLVSAAEAVVVSAAEKIEEKREDRMAQDGTVVEETVKIPFSRKLKWLSWLLGGGALLLAFEHIWHGEIVPWFPFLTAMNDASETAVMLHEMATVGVCMAVLVTVVWAVMCKVADVIVQRSASDAAQSDNA